MHPRAHVHIVFLENLSGHAPFGQLLWGELSIEGWLRPVKIESITFADWPNPARTGGSELRFADVFIRKCFDTPDARTGLDPTSADSHTGPRCGTAVMDESIDSTPYTWSHPHGLTEVYALPLFYSYFWGQEGKSLRSHGLLSVKWPIETYNRIGWFDSFASGRDEFDAWYREDEHRIITLQ